MRRNLPPSTVESLHPVRRRQTTIVLGVDPGTLVTGYGLIRRANGEMKLLDCGTIENPARHSMPVRLHHIYGELQSIIGKYHPDEFAIESAFYGKNVQSAMKLGHARGVSILAAVENQIPTSEYSPREVKKAVVGSGTASKQQVQFMVRSLLNLYGKKMEFDTSDALAIAICHLHRLQTPSVRHRDWKSFIAAHPERVRS